MLNIRARDVQVSERPSVRHGNVLAIRCSMACIRVQHGKCVWLSLVRSTYLRMMISVPCEGICAADVRNGEASILLVGATYPWSDWWNGITSVVSEAGQTIHRASLNIALRKP